MYAHEDTEFLRAPPMPDIDVLSAQVSARLAAAPPSNWRREPVKSGMVPVRRPGLRQEDSGGAASRGGEIPAAGAQEGGTGGSSPHPTGWEAFLPWGDRHPLSSLMTWLGFISISISLYHAINTLDFWGQVIAGAGVVVGFGIIVDRWAKPDINVKRLLRLPRLSRLWRQA